MSSGIEIRKAVIKNADMSEEMQADAVDCATQVRMQTGPPPPHRPAARPGPQGGR